MIDEIQVENLALIRKATLEPARGLTVLTGETGAGKTALLSALKLLMGERADKGSVRDGEDALQPCRAASSASLPWKTRTRTRAQSWSPRGAWVPTAARARP